MSLEDEINAIKLYYSSRWFWRSTAVTDAINQATIRFNNQTPSSAPTYTIPTYVPTYNSNHILLDSYDKLIEYLQIASTYHTNKDYDKVISTLESALPYARNISLTRESEIAAFIEDAKIKKSIKETLDACNYCTATYGKLAYWFNISGDILCECVQWYDLDMVQKKCIKSGISELSNAILRMYNNWLTKFSDPTSFISENWLRRDEATKFFVQYAKEVMWMTPDTSKTSCSFSDLSSAWSDLKDAIKESCQLWLFQWYNGKFMPTQKLTNAQAISVFIRLIDGKKDESGSHFANEYYTTAYNLWLLNNLNLNNKSLFNSFTTRGEVGTMLFRGKDLK